MQRKGRRARKGTKAVRGTRRDEARRLAIQAGVSEMRAQYCSTGRRIPVLEDRQIDRWVETREMDSQTVRLSMDNKEDRYYYHHLTLPYHFCYLPTTTVCLQYQYQYHSHSSHTYRAR